jgi:hypothetical protein
MKQALFAAILFTLFAAGPAWAGQTRCRVFDIYQAGGPGNNDRRMDACKDHCKKLSGGLDRLLSDGWTVESQRPIDILQRPFKTNEVGVPDEGFCRCKGAEYILKK